MNLCDVLADAFDYSAYSRLIGRRNHLTAHNVEFFGGALMNNRDLQVPMHRAHVAAALTGEGAVTVAEIPGEGVVGVAVW